MVERAWRLWPLLLLGCSDNGFSQLNTSDLFQQNRRNTFDLLVVVDNSCSMIEEQKKLAENFEAFIAVFASSAIESDWQLAVTTTDMEQEQFQGHLIGGDDEINLVDADGIARDSLNYDRDWAVESGKAWALDPSWASVIDNDALEGWCKLDGGSPGVANESCAETEGDGTDISTGAVMITEFMADPDGVADDVGEWVEIQNFGSEDVDLSGWSLTDNGRNAYAIPDGTSIAAGAVLVFGRSGDSASNGGVPVDLAVGTDFTLNNDVLVLTGQTEGAQEIFQEMVAQGTSGSGSEMGLEAARRALTEPLISSDNAGFLREDANLNILIVSDEEDSSPDPVATYLQAFADLKGDEAYRDHSLMNVSAVVGVDAPEFDGLESCSSDNGVAAYGSRYVTAVDWTDGLMDSICDEDFTPIVTDLGLLLSGLELEFTLSRLPDLDTLEVSIYESDSETKVKDLTIDVDYSYNEEHNSIVFTAEQVPESEQYILVSYLLRSG